METVGKYVVAPGAFSLAACGSSGPCRGEEICAGAFLSITVYDTDGFPQGDSYNSAFAIADEDGAYTTHFCGDERAVNHMEIFEGWKMPPKNLSAR